MKKVAILYIATGRYIQFWKEFYKSCEKHFLQNFRKDYYVFTDSKVFPYSRKNNVKITYQEKLGWPYDTMMRFDMFLKRKSDLLKYDYIFFFNANLKFLKTVGEEVLPQESQQLVVQIHPYYFDKENNEFTYDRNPKSKAYIPFNCGKNYYAGGLNGGIASEYLKMCDCLSAWTHEDLENGIIPLWHDESMLNKYMLNKNPLELPINYMLPEYCFTNERHANYAKDVKLILYEKSRFGGHEFLRNKITFNKVAIKIYIKKFIIGQNTNIIIPLSGRLGNNMFQWAFGRWYEQNTGIKPTFDITQATNLHIKVFNLGSSKYKKYFKLNKTFALSILSKTPFINKIGKKFINEMYNVIPFKEDIFLKYYEGFKYVEPPAVLQNYFQSYKYLEPVKDKLLSDFKLRIKMSDKNLDILDLIKHTESVAIHYRRTDYLSEINKNLYYMCTDNYYNDAVEYITRKINKETVLFIFSDDIQWAKENVKFQNKTIFVDINSEDKGFFDLELMKNCKHNIIANSSFSYMAAYLNINPNKIVVCPSKWYKPYDSTYDLYPPEWVKIGGQI